VSQQTEVVERMKLNSRECLFESSHDGIHSKLPTAPEVRFLDKISFADADLQAIKMK
jgi:hypothetical protein